MTVQQYEIRFNELSRFALALVAPTEQHMTRFVRGLEPKIYKDITSVDLLTFEENMKKAFLSEDRASMIKIAWS